MNISNSKIINTTPNIHIKKLGADRTGKDQYHYNQYY